MVKGSYVASTAVAMVWPGYAVELKLQYLRLDQTIV